MVLIWITIILLEINNYLWQLCKVVNSTALFIEPLLITGGGTEVSHCWRCYSQKGASCVMLHLHVSAWASHGIFTCDGLLGLWSCWMRCYNVQSWTHTHFPGVGVESVCSAAKTSRTRKFLAFYWLPTMQKKFLFTSCHTICAIEGWNLFLLSSF